MWMKQKFVGMQESNQETVKTGRTYLNQERMQTGHKTKPRPNHLPQEEAPGAVSETKLSD
jgi:hypothetical protein